MRGGAAGIRQALQRGTNSGGGADHDDDDGVVETGWRGRSRRCLRRLRRLRRRGPCGRAYFLGAMTLFVLVCATNYFLLVQAHPARAQDVSTQLMLEDAAAPSSSGGEARAEDQSSESSSGAQTTSSPSTQASSTIYDEAGVLTDDQRKKVQTEFDDVQSQYGYPLYGFLVSGSTAATEAQRRAYLENKAREAGVPQGAGAIVVDTTSRWGYVELGRLPGDPQQVFNGMRGDLNSGDWAAGFLAAAGEVSGKNASGGSSPGGSGPGSKDFSGNEAIKTLAKITGVLFGIALMAGLLYGGFLLAQDRHYKRTQRKRARRAAGERLLTLYSSLRAFDEQERNAASYLKARRPRLGREVAGEVEDLLEGAKSVPFGREINEADKLLVSDYKAAEARIERAEALLKEASEKVGEATRILDGCRAAEEEIGPRLAEASCEVGRAAAAEKAAREAGCSVVQPPSLAELAEEIERLKSEASARESRPEKGADPRVLEAAAGELVGQARARREMFLKEVEEKDRLPEKREGAENELSAAHASLDEYRRAYRMEEQRWGPAALAEAPDPVELSTGLHRARGLLRKSESWHDMGMFGKAGGLLDEAEALAWEASRRAPGALKTAVARADASPRENPRG